MKSFMEVIGPNPLVLLDSTGIFHTPWSYTLSDRADEPHRRISLHRHFRRLLLRRRFPVSSLNAGRNRRKSKMFGVVFPNRSFPMDISAFSQIDTFHWVLDMNTFVGTDSISIFGSVWILCFKTLIRIRNRLIRWSVRSNSWNVHILVE